MARIRYKADIFASGLSLPTPRVAMGRFLEVEKGQCQIKARIER